jgi:hypothetical protein
MRKILRLPLSASQADWEGDTFHAPPAIPSTLPAGELGIGKSPTYISGTFNQRRCSHMERVIADPDRVAQKHRMAAKFPRSDHSIHH